MPGNRANGTSGKKKKDEKDIFIVSPDRLVALTDGVFAITMTLLVIELFPGEIWGNPHGWAILYSYAMGFFSLGIFWTLHHYIFHFIERSTGLLTWLNILFLGASSLTPFWTKVVEFETEYEYGLQYFGIYMIFIMMTLFAIWIYATKDNRLVNSEFNRGLIKPFETTLTIGIIMVALVSVAGFFNPVLGNLLFIPGVFFVLVTVYGPHKIFK